MKMTQRVLDEVEKFYNDLKKGLYTHPIDFTIKLQALSDKAWKELDEIYSPSIRID